jgi:hypothetical protein
MILPFKAPVTLTFDLLTKKINTGILLTMTNQDVKYEDILMNTFPDNQQKF